MWWQCLRVSSFLLSCRFQWFNPIFRLGGKAYPSATRPCKTLNGLIVVQCQKPFSFHSVFIQLMFICLQTISFFLLNPPFVKVGIQVLVLKSISKTQWVFCVAVWHSSWRQKKILCFKYVPPLWEPGSDFEKVLVDVVYDSMEHRYHCPVGQQSHRENQTHVSWSPLL